VSVRRAEERDADAVLALMAGLGRPAVDADPSAQREVFLAHLADDSCAIFLAEDEGAIVGAAGLWSRPRLNWMTTEAWIPDLYVDPAYRRRGHARALLDACADEGRARGCHRLILESGHERADAHRLYEAYGFVHHARAYGLRLDR
jgi:ribosomal protein S18 acetylase RimI-like enzyme